MNISDRITKHEAISLSNRIYKKMSIAVLTDNNVHRMVQLLRRYNAVHKVAFPGVTDLTPGQALDDIIERAVFLSRL